MKRADSLLAPLIKGLKIEEAVRMERLRSGWQGLFEKPLSLHMSPSVLKEGELLVNVDSPVWLQQLGFYREEIIKKLCCFGVRSVRFRLGRVLPEKKQEKTIMKKYALSERERVFIEETLSGVKDSELRGAVKKAIEKSVCFSHGRAAATSGGRI